MNPIPIGTTFRHQQVAPEKTEKDGFLRRFAATLGMVSNG